MGIAITATDVRDLGGTVWEFDMPPHQVRIFGDALHSDGARTVVLLNKAAYNRTSRTLTFDADDVVTLNIGTGPQTIAIGHIAQPVGGTGQRAESLRGELDTATGLGDQKFLSLAARLLSREMHSTAKALLTGVRLQSPGDLKRGEKNNFSNTPDNFWYVIVQPRIDQLSITVRGPVSHFDGIAALELKDDRGNTRFKVSRSEDVREALKLILHAKRKQ